MATIRLEKLFENKNSAKFWKILSEQDVLSRELFEEYIIKAKEEERNLSEVIIEGCASNKDKILKAVSDYLDLPVVCLKEIDIKQDIKELVSIDIAEQYSFIPFNRVNNDVHIATTTPENLQISKFLKKKTGLNPIVYITSPDDINHAFGKQIYFKIENEFVKIAHSKNLINNTLERSSQNIPIGKIIDRIIEKAIKNNVSDIHIEPNTEKITIRFRIDGVLNKVGELPKTILSLLVSRVKIMSDLKIDEHDSPLDGRFQVKHDGKDVSIRVSIIPTLVGPKVSLRILTTNQKMFSLSDLGLNKIHYDLIKKEIKSANGMILVTGPTGSGKTTTLYTMLQILNKEEVNITTIEDPVEYKIENINQIQIKPKAGLNFSNGLKALLRQDPDIIMIGEIRDGETVKIAVDSAMTGHLVLSTTHTNNAFLTPQRLIEMGSQPYLVSSVLNLVIGQRLARKICPHCKKETNIGDRFVNDMAGLQIINSAIEKLKKLKLLPETINFFDLKYYYGEGCHECNGTGYKGRQGIFEVIKINEGAKTVISSKPLESEIFNYYKANTLTMLEDGIYKAINGITTIDEVLRVANK